jgi:hypothetical protein
VKVPFDVDDLELMRAAMMAVGWRGEDMRRAGDIVDRLDGAIASMRQQLAAPPPTAEGTPEDAPAAPPAEPPAPAPKVVAGGKARRRKGRKGF